jgi:hypothetical protein
MAARREQPAGCRDAATPFMLHVIAGGQLPRRAPAGHAGTAQQRGHHRPDRTAPMWPSASARCATPPCTCPAAGQQPRPGAGHGRHRCGAPRRLQDLAVTPCWASPSRRPQRLAAAHGHTAAAPAIASSSGETLRQLALAGSGIVCLSDFMTRGTAGPAGWCRCSCGRAWTSARPSTRSTTAHRPVLTHHQFPGPCGPAPGPAGLRGLSEAAARRAAGPAQQHGAQCLRLEGLGHEVVHPRIQAALAVLGHHAGTHGDDGQAGGRNRRSAAWPATPSRQGICGSISTAS